MTPIDRYGPLLLKMRREAGVSQREVARRARMSPTTVRRLERGEMNVKCDGPVRYAAALGVTLTYRFVAKP